MAAFAGVFIVRSGARQFFLLPEGRGDFIPYCRGNQVGRGSFTRDSTECDFEIAAQITAGRDPATRPPAILDYPPL